MENDEPQPVDRNLIKIFPSTLRQLKGFHRFFTFLRLFAEGKQKTLREPVERNESAVRIELKMLSRNATKLLRRQ